jgi:predicted NUDIX family phosphoesterase
MKEETGIELSPSNCFFEGFIYDPSNEVGTVHVGVLFSYYTKITTELVSQIMGKEEIHNVMVLNKNSLREFLNEEDTVNDPYKLEKWAQITLSRIDELARITNE